jgi:hypothetical protein
VKGFLKEVIYVKKRILAFLLALGLLSTAGQALAIQAEPADAGSTNSAAPRLALINTVSPTLSVTGSTAAYTLSVICASTVTSVSATLQLQKRNSDLSYSDYGTSWNASSSSSYLSTSGTKTVTSGYTYRLKVTVTAYTATLNSTVTEYS